MQGRSYLSSCVDAPEDSYGEQTGNTFFYVARASHLVYATKEVEEGAVEVCSLTVPGCTDNWADDRLMICYFLSLAISNSVSEREFIADKQL